MAKTTTNGDYEVGYKKPPKQHRFKPGNPGGPGRQKKSTLENLIEEELFRNDGENARKIAENIVESATCHNIKAVQIILTTTKKG